MSAPLAPIDNIKVLQGEPKGSCQFLDPVSELSFGKGGQLVEQRLDKGRVDQLHDERK